MATVEQCEHALHGLAARLADRDPAQRKGGFDRSLACTLRDLDITFAGQLRDGDLEDIHQVSTPDAQIRLALTSDDLLRLVDGQLNLAAAWATGRLTVQAGMRDMMRLRSIF